MGRNASPRPNTFTPLNWSCLHTAPKQENKVAQLLTRELELETFAPRIRFRRMRAGQPVWTTEALFPGYLFARFEYSERRRQINSLPGVTSVVHFGEQISPVDDTVMSDLRALVSDNETVEVNADPQPGSEVVITGGPLSWPAGACHPDHACAATDRGAPGTTWCAAGNRARARSGSADKSERPMLIGDQGMRKQLASC